jgi:chromosome segregation ATPase
LFGEIGFDRLFIRGGCMGDHPADRAKWWDQYQTLNEEAEQIEAEIERLEVETKKVEIYEQLKHINAQLEVCYRQRAGNKESRPMLEAEIRRLERERRMLEQEVY